MFDASTNHVKIGRAKIWHGQVRNQGEDGGEQDRTIEALQHAVVFRRARVVADERLHPHGDSENESHQQLVDGQDDAESRHGEQAAVLQKHVVLERPDDAAGHVDRERRTAVVEDAPEVVPAVEAEGPPVELRDAAARAEEAHDPDRRRSL